MYCLHILTVSDSFEEVDLSLDSNQQIALTRQLNNVANILEPRSNFAKNISLLGTPRTMKALGFRHRADLTVEAERILIGKTYRAILEYKTLNVLEGEALLEIKGIDTDHTTGLPIFEVFFTGTRYNWASELANMTVQSLHSYFPTFTRDDTVCRNTWDRVAFPDSYIGCTFYPFYYGAFHNFNSIGLKDLRGHIYFMYLVEKALESIGYEVIGSWKDWEETRGLTVPFHGEQLPDFDPTGTSPTAKELEYGMTTGNPFVETKYKDGFPFYFENPYVDLNPSGQPLPDHWTGETGTFTCKVHGSYQIEWSCSGSNSVPGSHFKLVVESKLKGIIYDQVLPGGPGGSGSSGIGAIRWYQEGDEITFKMVNVGDPENVYTVGGTSQSITIRYRARYADWPVSEAGFNATHEVPPDLTVGEVLEGVADMYGLHAITDGIRKTIEFLPAQQFYKDEFGEDITHLIDFSQPIKELPALDNCSNIYMKFQNANDKLAQNQEALLGPLYGDIVPEEEAGVCQDVRTNPTFYPTWFRDPNEASSNYMVPATSPKGAEAYNPGSGHDLWDYLDHNIGARILYFAGKRGNDPQPPSGYTHFVQEMDYNPDDGSPVINLVTTLPYAYMADNWRAAVQNLGFHDEFGTGNSVYLGYANKRVWDSNYGTGAKTRVYIGAKNWWYKTLLTLQQNKRRFKAFVNMTPVQYLQMNFRTLKFVDSKVLGSARYVLSSINDYNPQTQQGSVQLLMYKQQPNDCPQTLEELGFIWQIIDTPTQLFGVSFAFTDTEFVLEDRFIVYSQHIFIDNNPTPSIGAWALPGSLGTDGWNYDVYSWSGVGFSPIQKVVSGQSQRRVRFVGSARVSYTDGRECEISYCLTLLYNSAGTLIESTFREICSDAVEEIPELTAVCCFDNFIEVSDHPTLPTVLPNALAATRFYTLNEFTVNGATVNPGAVGQSSVSFNAATAAWLNCLGYGYGTCTGVANGLLANNFDFLLFFLNSLGLGYVNFSPSIQSRCVEYAPGIPFTLEVGRDIGGVVDTYRIEYDGINDPNYLINGLNYNNYRLACFDTSEAAPQAIVEVTQINESTVELNFTKSIAADGTEAGTRGEHTYTIRAVKQDGTPISGTSVTFTAVDPADTLTGPEIAALEAALGVQAVSGTYGVITIILGAIPTGSFPGGDYKLGEIEILNHSFTESFQTDVNPDATRVYSLRIATFDQQCFADATNYPLFTNFGVGGLEEIQNPGGAALIASEINNILLRYDGTYYVMDRDPQSPNIAKWFEVDYGNGWEATQTIHLLQGPYTDYTTTGMIGDLRTAWAAEFGGNQLYLDSIWFTRMLQFGISHSGLFFRSETRFRNDTLPQRIKIRLNDDTTTYFVFRIQYLDQLAYGSVWFQSSGGGGGT